ncbi:uncharacterized protein EAF02_000636 [Botrytis sinoallii]|nr:uncharacterized protein EAF02_000636 [Botrytis sinoallii]XP_038810917.1 uncharacterized protein EAE98_005453 [Botrytis deweyae]KAF7893098.1 hypothetical protein EAF02_000636 [Botrytis sinoallii]KAF7929535.1 hypothetical protein EAE98_005453 [Botrytis deweyae]KAF7938266.1 hypothetical protein EAE99_001938 [Botrytis elliptica]
MNSQQTTAVKGGTGSVATPANNVNYRRGSQEGTLFSGLQNQKRSSSDAASKARRESFAEQAPKAGFVGQMWNSIVKGQ